VVVVSIALPLKVLSGAVALFIRTDALLALSLLVSRVAALRASVNHLRHI